MKRSELSVIVGLLACLAAQAANWEKSLPGSRWTVEEAVKGRARTDPNQVAYVGVYEALEDTLAVWGNMTGGATQKFKVVGVLAGPAPEGAVTLDYAIGLEEHEREIKKGERVIWVFIELADNRAFPVKAVADTDGNRQAVLAALKAAGIATTAPARQPATQPVDKEAAAKLKSRITARTFPSVFQAWNPADNLKPEDQWTTMARHDLVFHDARFFGLRWDGDFIGLASRFVPESVPAARKLREELLRNNPNLILLAEIRYRDAPRSYLPEGHAWWKRKDGALVMGWAEGGFVQLDFTNPDFRAQVAKQAKAAVDSGVFDGVMLDWWHDDEDRLALIKAVRAAVGEEALILVNANDRTTPKTAPFVNGYFMECYKSKTAQDWKQIADTLVWAEANLKEPRINCVETWFHTSRRDLNLMRATTTLALTLSDGYCLFSDPNPLPTPDHLHDWYDFWNKSLGKPAAKGFKRDDGSYQRAFERGTAVYNPMGNEPVTVMFDKACKRVSTQQEATSFIVPPGDGDIFLLQNTK